MSRNFPADRAVVAPEMPDYVVARKMMHRITEVKAWSSDPGARFLDHLYLEQRFSKWPDPNQAT